jgi:hypothetical protein
VANYPNPQIAQFLSEDWAPVLYDAVAIHRTLKVDPTLAMVWVEQISGSRTEQFVADHDLREYLNDTFGVSKVPLARHEVSKGAHWLVEECGWGFTDEFQKYRYIDTADGRNLRYTLRVALKIEMHRQLNAFRHQTPLVPPKKLTHADDRHSPSDVATDDAPS